MTDKPFGGIAREDRIDQDDGPWCDKAWHLPHRARATAVVTCAHCGRKYARCPSCNRGRGSAAASMRAHVAAAHRGTNPVTKRKVVPNEP